MNLTNERSSAYDEIWNAMFRVAGQSKLDTDQRAPADSVQRRGSASGMRSNWEPVVTVALILGFLWGLAWLILTHV